MLTTANEKTESQRLEALRRTHLVGAEAEASICALARSIAHATGAPIAAISLIDEDRQRLLCRVGMEVDEIPREISMCAHVILETEPVAVDNVFDDQRFFNNPCVTGPPNVRAYLGAPLIVEGAAIGSLCAVDTDPRQWTEANIAFMRELANVAGALIEQRTMRFDLLDAVTAMSRRREARPAS